MKTALDQLTGDDQAFNAQLEVWGKEKMEAARIAQVELHAYQTALHLWWIHLVKEYGLKEEDTVDPTGKIVRKGA